MNRPLMIITCSVSLTLAACEPASQKATEVSPQDLFFERLTLLCGKAYQGKLVSKDDADADMAGKPMIMHVSHCEQHRIEIPFHVNEGEQKWNRSRSWIITRNKGALRLKHRHRHEDGILDTITNYGGDTIDFGSAERQEFPVDPESIALFNKEGLNQSTTNIWAIEVGEPGTRDAKFAYELRRPEGPNVRHFRVEFDLAKQIDAPPAPWGG